MPKNKIKKMIDMAKRTISIIGNDEDVLEARAKGINISEFLRENLKAYLHSEGLKKKLNTDQIISKLNREKADLMKTVNQLSQENKKLLKEIEVVRSERKRHYAPIPIS